MKVAIVEILKEALKELDLKYSDEQIFSLIEIPPTSDMGDYAFPCFSLAKEMKISPRDIALQVREKIGGTKKQFEDIQTEGPYVNFFANKKLIAEKLIPEIISKDKNYGKITLKKPLKTMVEFPSPNTNKPLHLGHLRNMSIGASVSNILEFNGEKVIQANLNNDRGIHICKSMAAYERYGKNKKPTKKIKSDHFVGDFYVMFNKKSNDALEVRAHEMLRLWEQGDKEIHDLWKKMNKWALDGFEETYKKFGIKHNVEFFESKIYKKGKDIVEKGVKDKVFEKKKDNSISINLEKEKLGEKVLLRSDGTSVYMTQDLHLAKLKFDKYKLDKSIYVVGNEQDYHFNVLFIILKKLGLEKEMYHLSYGEVFLPGWKKIKSREGTKGITMDEIFSKVDNLVKKELEKRDKISKKELEKRSKVIALAAIKYMILQVDMKRNMIFDPQGAISFEGNTGPYLLYAYARASSILRKVKPKKKSFNLKSLEPKESELLKKLKDFAEVISKAKTSLNPSLVAHYSYELAQLFNEFYHDCPVMNSENEIFRLKLVEAFRIVLRNSLNLLGIETLEKM
jgi:arginyl-tRNA synthetase